MNFMVNGHAWVLQFARPSSENLRRSDGSWTFGTTDNSVKTVFILDGMSEYMTDKVLCHELTHVFSFENNCYIPIETEEIIADFMSLYGRSIIYLADDLMRSVLRRIA